MTYSPLIWPRSPLFLFVILKGFFFVGLFVVGGATNNMGFFHRHLDMLAQARDASSK